MLDTGIGLDAGFLKKLERLTLVARKPFIGQLKGDKPSPKHGSSVEFADFRSYTPGDDFRHVDWNAYGRLDRLFLKMFREEEDLHLYLLVDVSESMRFGEPDTKLDVARRLAAALGYLGLTSLDRVAAAAFTNRLVSRLRLTRGRKYVPRLFRFLAEAGEPDDSEGEREVSPTHLANSLKEFAIRTYNPGICVVISDFLDPGGYREAITALLGLNFDLNIVQVLTPEELKPDLAGDLRLVDSETGEQREITISRGVLSRYEERAEGYCEELKQFCVGRGCGYSRVLTTDSLEDFVLRRLRRAGTVA